MQVRLEVKGLPKGPNKLSGRHWTVVHAERKLWKEKVGWLAKSQYKGEPWDKAKIHFSICVGDKRRHDPDNIIASLKGVIDSLTGTIIKDDSIDNIELSFSFTREGERGFVIECEKVA